jgi:transcriptional regulator with XRE-family HTH domain
VLREVDLSPVLGLPVVVPRFSGFRCGRDRSHVVLDGTLVEQARFVAAFTALEMGYLVHADLARYLRRYMGLTQADLATKMGVERITVARWESDEHVISPQNDYVLRGIAREHLKAQLSKPWARALEPRFRALPDVFLERVRTDPPPSEISPTDEVARALAEQAA